MKQIALMTAFRVVLFIGLALPYSFMRWIFIEGPTASAVASFLMGGFIFFFWSSLTRGLDSDRPTIIAWGVVVLNVLLMVLIDFLGFFSKIFRIVIFLLDMMGFIHWSEVSS